jgi:lysophospholipase L1-like esterase
MAYTKQNFQSGGTLYASELNAMDNQIYDNTEKIIELENALENATIEPADSVEWLNENGDTAKKYSLPDGYVYAYMQKLVDVVHNANDGTCVENARPAPNSAINTAPVTNSGATGNLITAPIQLDKTQNNHKINLSGLEMLYTNYYTPCYVFYYGADGAWIGYGNVRDLGVTPSIVDGTLTLPASFDVSKNASFFASATQIVLMIGVKLNTKIGSADYASLVINCEWLDRQEYIWGWHNTGNKINDDETTRQNTADIADLQGRMTVVEEKIASGVSTGPLFAKLGLIGDSLTAQDYQGWQALTVSMLGSPELHKNAIVGSCVATYENQDKPSFVDRYLETPEDCDCIVIMGGTNDTTKKGGNDMGEVGVLNNNTFKGAYSTIIEGLLTRNPATRVMLITPPRSYTTNYEERTATKKYAEATVEVAKYYGLPCLDFYDTLGWNAVTAPWCARDFTGETYGQVDTLHFSNDIGPRVGRMVANFIRNNY